jgi:hypothetical protein
MQQQLSMAKGITATASQWEHQKKRLRGVFLRL